MKYKVMGVLNYTDNIAEGEFCASWIVGISVAAGTIGGGLFCKVFSFLGIMGTVTYHFPVIQMICFGAAVLEILILYGCLINLNILN